MKNRFSKIVYFFCGWLIATMSAQLADGDDKASAPSGTPVGIADVQHDGPVEFERDILPILRRNCLACHNRSDAENDLVLETPQTILTGGSEGPAVKPGDGSKSLLLKVAARQSEPFMPPADNEVGARNLTPQELGLLKLWIDQGSKGDVTGRRAPIAWQPLPRRARR